MIAQDDQTSVAPSENQTSPVLNNPPVIFGGITFSDYYHGSNGTTSEDVLYTRNALAVDFDGRIVEFGIDVNMDGAIDYSIDQSTSGPDWKMINETDSDEWKNPHPVNTWSTHAEDVQYCIQHLSMIAVDDDGAMTVIPFQVQFNYDRESSQCQLTN